jgi:capsid protein
MPVALRQRVAALSQRTRARQLTANAATSYGAYDATESRGRRRAPFTRTVSEDRVADERRRSMLSATAQDVCRNWVLAKWIIRKHLDYVTTFSFQAKTTDRGFNAYLEAWHNQQSTRQAFDVAKRHPLRRAIRISEAMRVIDGRVGWLKLAPKDFRDPRRGRIQAIEGDRIRSDRGVLPENAIADEWVNGVRVDPVTGEDLAYAICKRIPRSTRLELDRIVPASSMLMHQSFEFRFDQVAGVSPLAAALNPLRDLQENVEYTNARIKLGQLFGLQIHSNSQEVQWERSDDGYSVDFNQRGPFILEMDPGDKAEMIEPKGTSADTNAYLELLILMTLKALDIPYSFYDESHTNFFGSRAGLIHYQRSSADRIADNQSFLSEYEDWRLALAVEDGSLELPRGKGLEFLAYEYVPRGTAWWNPVQEVKGAAMAIAAGLSSPQRECRESGSDFEENIREIAAAQAYAKEQGVDLVYADSSAFAPSITVEAGAE